MSEGKENGDARDDRGRFLPGNPGGPGNPHAKRAGEFKAAILEALTPQDVTRIVHKLVELACAGDVPAAKELLNRVLGKGVLAAGTLPVPGSQSNRSAMRTTTRGSSAQRMSTGRQGDSNRFFPLIALTLEPNVDAPQVYELAQIGAPGECASAPGAHAIP